MRATPFALAATACLLVAPASAQDTPAPPPAAPEFDTGADRVTVGIGAATVPSYEGSDRNRIIPLVAAQGQIGGYAFSTSGARLFVDAIRNEPGPVIDVQLGPVIGGNFNRTGGIRDAQVRALGKRDFALELGGYVGIGKTGVITSPYDKVSVNITYQHDVLGTHDSYQVIPEINYGTPLSRKAYVAVSANATYSGKGYARTYFGVDPAGALRSGLPVFDARDGWKNYALNALGSYALTGDLFGGVSLVGGVSYTRLLNDFRSSPVTAIAGDDDQWYGAIGVAYTF